MLTYAVAYADVCKRTLDGSVTGEQNATHCATPRPATASLNMQLTNLNLVALLPKPLNMQLTNLNLVALLPKPLNMQLTNLNLVALLPKPLNMQLTNLNLVALLPKPLNMQLTNLNLLLCYLNLSYQCRRQRPQEQASTCHTWSMLTYAYADVC